jgi:isochorismate synthase EntC
VCSQVVLAQRVSLDFSAALEPMHLLQRLLEVRFLL